jgi:hypothetical protein
MSESTFAKYKDLAWPYKFTCTLHLYSIAGGVPSDPTVAEAWIRSKVQGPDDMLKRMAEEAIAARFPEGFPPGPAGDAGRKEAEEQAIRDLNRLKHLNGFKRDANGLYIEGRQVKAALKEGASIAAAAGKLALQKWGYTNKYIQGFVAEHIVVPDEIIYLGRDEPDVIVQSFPENKRIGQRGIQLTEVCRDVDITFTVKSDWGFTQKEWAMIWLTGAEEGLGACRSQGYGRYSDDIEFAVLGLPFAPDEKSNSGAARGKAARKDEGSQDG